VEEVVLHLADDAAEHRQEPSQHAVAAHAAQRPGEALGAHDLHEAAPVLARLAEAAVDVRQRARERAKRARTEPDDLRVGLQPPECLEDHSRLLLEELLVADLEVAAHDLEVGVERLGLALRFRRDPVEEIREQDLVEAPDRLGREVVAAHEQIRGRHSRRSHELQLPGDLDLVVEDEAVFAPPGEVMQADAKVLQHALVDRDGGGLVRRDEVLLGELAP
jgi:hypothetical protein